jgi:hypothetical protein
MNIKKQITLKIVIKTGKEISIETSRYTGATSEMTKDERVDFMKNECIRIGESNYIFIDELRKNIEKSVENMLIEKNNGLIINTKSVSIISN